MGWSGATFTLLHDFSAFRDANPGAEYIDADDVDEQFTDIKGGLEALLLRDGSNSPSANIDFNGQLITNLGAPSADTHAARLQDIVLQDHVAGLAISNSSTDSDHDIDIATGLCLSTDGTQRISLASGLTKQIDSAWAVGDDAGGLDTGTVAATTMYAVWLIRRSDTGAVDVLFSTSFTWSGVTKPTNYDQGQLIGAICTNATSNVEPFVQAGDYFAYTNDDAGILDINDSTITSLVSETGTLSAAPNSLVTMTAALINPTSTNTNGYVFVHHTGSSPTSLFYNASGHQVSANFDRHYDQMVRLVDDNSQIKYTVEELSGSATVQLMTQGFLMTKRGSAA